MTNNKLTDEKIKTRINAIEDRRSASRDFWDGDWEYPEDIELLALRELQERRKVEGIYHLATLYEIDGVFTKDPCVLANARGRKVQGYVELELANMFYKENKS